MSADDTGKYQVVKRCPHCSQLFMPDKFHPRQQYCSATECREERKRNYKANYNQQWKEQNPNYFKDYWLSYRGMK